MNKELAARIASHQTLSKLSFAEIFTAVQTFEEYFSKKYQFWDDKVIFFIKKNKKFTTTIDVLNDALPAIIYAHRHFGKVLPDDVISKFQNITQIEDTFFEFKCMGLFIGRHKVIYEPKLSDGKVPDFQICPEGFPDVYVECKSLNEQDSEYLKKFNKVGKSIIETIGKSNFVNQMWDRGYRVEILPAKYITKEEIDNLNKTLEKVDPLEFIKQERIIKNILISCIPIQQVSKEGNFLKMGSVMIRTGSTNLSHVNMHIIVHSWKSINIQMRRSLRSLFKDARLKLKNISKGSVGVVFLEMKSGPNVLPDIHGLLKLKEYSCIAMVCMNPFNGVKTLYRKAYSDLKDKLAI